MSGHSLRLEVTLLCSLIANLFVLLVKQSLTTWLAHKPLNSKYKLEPGRRVSWTTTNKSQSRVEHSSAEIMMLLRQLVLYGIRAPILGPFRPWKPPIPYATSHIQSPLLGALELPLGGILLAPRWFFMA